MKLNAFQDVTLTLGALISLCVVPQIASAETLAHYSAACNSAIGFTIPTFDCDAGTLVPTTNANGDKCDRPNVLNHVCDPGSKFQVLRNDSTGYAVAHCRKQGRATGQYGDIAVIQYNKSSGATCFYQALGTLDHLVLSPSLGSSQEGIAGAYDWLPPIRTAGIGCVRCHDNGPLIRSPYLTQVTGTNRLPGAGDSAFNRNQPYAFVGEDFASWTASKVTVAGNDCISCHRMGKNSISSAEGTALELGLIATAATQTSKNPHSTLSPIWMAPGQITYSAASENAARQIANCAANPASAGCTVTTYATALAQLGPAFQRRVLETATAFANENNGTWTMADWDGDHVPDLVYIKTRQVWSGQVEVHVASGASQYQARIYSIASVFGQENNGTWLMTDWDRDGIPDLAYIKTSYTPSGRVEVHVASGASNFQSHVVATVSAFGNETNGIWTLADWDKDRIPDLIYVKTSSTPSGHVEVHVASGASGFKSFVFQAPTTFWNENSGTWSMSDWDADGSADLVYIKTAYSSTGKVEIHISSAVSRFLDRSIEVPTTFDVEQNGAWLLTDWNTGGIPDLTYIKSQVTPSNYVEVHIAAGR